MARKTGKVPFRRSFLVAAGVAALAVALVAVFWPWISAQYRAVVVLSTVLETPVLTSSVEGLTGEPRIEDEPVAGVPTLVAKPAGEGPHPALVFMNGAVPPGREERTVNDLAEGLARAGYAVYVPDVAGLRTGEISRETVSETVEVARSVAGDPETAGGRVGLVGVSVGASLALLAAADEGLRDRVSVVSAVAPYTDLENVLRLATTEVYPGEDGPFRFETPPYLRLLTARSLVSMLPEGEEKRSLLRLIPEIHHYYPPAAEADEPLAALPAFKLVNEGDLDPETEGVLEVLTNDDPERFDELYAGLSPRIREEIRSLSPVTAADRITAPVEISTAPRDTYFPVAESRALAGEVPDFRLTVTRAMNHAEPEPSDLPAFLELNGFVVRSLRVASLRSFWRSGGMEEVEESGKSRGGRELASPSPPLEPGESPSGEEDEAIGEGRIGSGPYSLSEPEAKRLPTPDSPERRTAARPEQRAGGAPAEGRAGSSLRGGSAPSARPRWRGA